MQLQEIVRKHGKAPENLIQILLECQDAKERKFLSEEEIKYLSEELKVSEAHICSVVSFYTLLSLKPRGKHIVQVCTNLPCHINGAVDIVEELQGILGVKMGGTTGDGLFTLEHTSCLGCCDKAPAMRIDKTLYTGLDGKKLAGIISGYRGKK